MAELTLIQLNDLHGYMEPHPEWLWSPSGFRYQTMGGLARMKTVIDRLRDSAQNVLLTDNGDTLHGTRAVVESKGRCLVPVMNRLGISAMTGHWDFAYGPEHLKELVSTLTYPFLAANVFSCESGQLVFPASTTINLGSIRIGIIGLACNIVDKVMPPHFSTGIRFTNGKQELPAIIEQLRRREGCDIVILLSHLGLPQDLALLEEVSGIDVCLSGHTHNRLERPVVVGKTFVIQSGCHGSFLGMLRLKVEAGGISLLEHRLIPINEDVEEDLETKELVGLALGNAGDEQNMSVGYTDVALNRATMLESTADFLLLDAMRSITGTQLAFINGWRYGAPIPEGIITVGALHNLAPMDPEITTVNLRGEEIWEMIEENLERTFAKDPFGQMGGYVKRCGGMTTFFKAENPNGARVQEVFVGDVRLDRGQLYTASFITTQAVPEKYGTRRIDTAIRLIDAVTTLLRGGYKPSGLRNSFVAV
jgi:S-sulfosulfanyl-L-cysteine sulfohydrolase